MGTAKVIDSIRAIDLRRKVALQDGLVTVEPADVKYLPAPRYAFQYEVGARFGAKVMVDDRIHDDPEERAKWIEHTNKTMRVMIAREVFSDVYQTLNDLYPDVAELRYRAPELAERISSKLYELEAKLRP